VIVGGLQKNMSEKEIKVSKEEAFDKIDQQIKKDSALVEEGSETFKKSMRRVRRVDDNFENKYKIWLKITWEIIGSIFISSNYSYEFKKRISSQTEYVSSDWKPDIKYWITKELIPKIDYLIVLRENINEFEYIPEKQKSSINDVSNLNNQKIINGSENDANDSKEIDLSEERVILEKLEVLLEDSITKSGYDTMDNLLNWSNKVTPLLQFNPQLQSKFLSYQELAVLSRLKTQTRQAFQIMKSQVGMAIEELKLLIDFTNSGEPVREKMFPKGFYYDASKELRDIVKSAKYKIYVIDNYIDENILDFFTMKESNVKLKFITKNITKAAQQMINSYTKQYRNLEIRTSDNYHDRFIIVDEKTFYHFGASLKDLGNKVFMFSEIEENENKKMLLENWQNDWIDANKIK